MNLSEKEQVHVSETVLCIYFKVLELYDIEETLKTM